MKKSVLLVAVLSSAALVAVIPSTAEAGDTLCVGTLSGTFDNVIVPPGATCYLSNSTVSGNVKALADSRLLMDDVNVRGNVEGDGADIVQIFFSQVRQYISIKEGGPAEGPAPNFNVCGFGMNFTPCEVLIIRTTVEEGGVQVEKIVGDVLFGALATAGNLKVEENSIPEILLIQNSNVAQNLQVFKNVGPGNKIVQGNTVGDSLQCFENEPPFNGQFNSAGKAEGQCAPPEAP